MIIEEEEEETDVEDREVDEDVDRPEVEVWKIVRDVVAVDDHPRLEEAETNVVVVVGMIIIIVATILGLPLLVRPIPMPRMSNKQT